MSFLSGGYFDKTKIKNLNINNENLAYIIFFIIMLIKSGYYLFTYNPILDDFIQYGVYKLYDNPFKDILLKADFLSARPLAGIFDIYIWSNFYNNLNLAFIIITIMFSVSGILLFKLFKHHFNVSFVFLLCFGLLPLGSEGVNWLSASTRLVVPVFFMSVGLILMQMFFDTQKIYACVLCQFFIVLSFGFYEQIIILSFLLTLGLIIINRKSKIYYLLALIPSIIIAIPYCCIRSQSLYGQRVSVISFNNDLLQHVAGVFDAIFNALIVLSDDIVNNGLRLGLEIVKNDQNYLFVFVLLLSLIGVFFISYKRNENEDQDVEDQPDLLLLFVSIVLILAPMSIFFIIKNPWISLRNVFPSIIGLSLFIDLIFRYVVRINAIKSILITLLCFVFIMANVAELHDYLKSGLIDQKIAKNTVQYITENNIKTSMTIIGTKEAYIKVATPYHEHIHNITSSNWAYKGSVTATAKSLSMPNIYPIAHGKINKLYPHIEEINNFYTLDENFNIIPLTYTRYNDNYNIYKDGELFAEILMYDKNEPVLVLIPSNKKVDFDK